MNSSTYKTTFHFDHHDHSSENASEEKKEPVSFRISFWHNCMFIPHHLFSSLLSDSDGFDIRKRNAIFNNHDNNITMLSLNIFCTQKKKLIHLSLSSADLLTQLICHAKITKGFALSGFAFTKCHVPLPKQSFLSNNNSTTKYKLSTRKYYNISSRHHPHPPIFCIISLSYVHIVHLLHDAFSR